MNNHEMLLLKLGEVVLKGQNRRSFEDRLVANVARRLKSCGSFQVYIRQSTIYAEPTTDRCDMEAAYAAARQVFGVVSAGRRPLREDGGGHCGNRQGLPGGVLRLR